jgi:hypothetical protein
MTSRHAHVRPAVIALTVVVNAAIGVYLLGSGSAATYVSSAEAESGTVAGAGAAKDDAGASGGKLVQFGGTATQNPEGGCAVGGDPAPCIGGPATGASGWTLSFRDEFNGTSLDLSKWESTWFGDGTRMNNVGTYARNVNVADGEVRLQLSSSGEGALIHTGYKPGHYQYPVGSFVEARIYFPGSSGTTLYNWPAWWANSTEGYPRSGEHDIAEVLGSGTLTVNYHSPSGAHNQGSVPGNWGNSYHTYALHRQASKADVYWDGRLVKSYDTDDDGAPEDLILNVGSGAGPTKTGAEGAMRVDYVRAWRR